MKRSEKQGRDRRYIQLNAEFQRIAGRDKKVFFNEQDKRITGLKDKNSRDLVEKRSR